MNKTISILRIALLYVLVTVASVCILSEHAYGNWLTFFIVSKTIGFSCVLMIVKLSKRWKNDLYIQKLNKWMDEVE